MYVCTYINAISPQILIFLGFSHFILNVLANLKKFSSYAWEFFPKNHNLWGRAHHNSGAPPPPNGYTPVEIEFPHTYVQLDA